MRNTEIIVRADGDYETGMMHISRGIAICQMVKELAPVFFATQFPGPFISKLIPETISALTFPAEDYEDAFLEYVKERLEEKQVILVLEGYEFYEPFQQTFREAGAKIVLIHNRLYPHHQCDVLINTDCGITLDSYNSPTKADLYSGDDYALIRPLFMEAAKKKAAPTRDPRKVFICFGSTDLYDKTLSMLQVMTKLPQFEELTVLSSSLYRNVELLEFCRDRNDPRIRLYLDADEATLFNLISQAELCITSAGTLALEVMAVGKPLMCTTTHYEQKPSYSWYTETGLCYGFEDYWKYLHTSFYFKFLENPELRETMVRRQKLYLDGLSGERICGILKALMD